MTETIGDHQPLSDEVWSRLSEREPYWSVLSIDKYRGELSGNSKEEFFRSGELNVQHYLDMALRLQPRLKLTTVIDFGCGVGRLTIPLCRRAQKVFAVDISPTMLLHCRQNCKEAGLFNVIPVKSDDALSGLDGIVADLIVSSITFQHIRPERGLRLLRALLDRLKPGGVLCVFLLISGENDRASDDVEAAAIRAQPEAYIEMNVYPLDLVTSMLSRFTDEITLGLVPMGKHLGADFFAARRAEPARR
jgi:SAM-dependent methyltransferase